MTLVHTPPARHSVETLHPPNSWLVCEVDGLLELLADPSSTLPNLTLVEFWAPDCLFSRLLAPVRVQIPGRFGGRVRLLCCCLDSVATSAAAFGADCLPSLVLFNGSTRVRRWRGAIDVSLLQHQLAAFLADHTP